MIKKLKNTLHFKNIEIENEYFYIDIGNKTVLVKAEEEGVVVDVFQKPKKDEGLGEPITSTWAFYNEGEE